jgi:sugar/nucleoside kinase (ribokinase family)
MPSYSILGIGGAHMDRRGRVSGEFIPGASNPGVMGEDVGGGTFNALRTAVQRGVEGALMSVRGGDAAGATVAQAIAQAGIRDLSAIFLDRGTPSYTALLGRDGDVIAALADMGLYEIAFARQLRRSSIADAAQAADAILCDANLPADALARVAALAPGKPLFAIAISPAKAVRLAAVLPALAGLFLNSREAAALTGLDAASPPVELLEALRDKGVSRAVLTKGEQKVFALDGGAILQATPPEPRRIVDVTGAGDAIAGAAIAAIVSGRPFAEAVREGMAAALLTIESTVAAPRMPRAAFAAALALVPALAPVHQGAAAGEHYVA